MDPSTPDVRPPLRMTGVRPTDYVGGDANIAPFGQPNWADVGIDPHIFWNYFKVRRNLYEENSSCFLSFRNLFVFVRL